MTTSPSTTSATSPRHRVRCNKKTSTGRVRVPKPAQNASSPCPNHRRRHKTLRSQPMTSTESSPRRQADEFDTDLNHHSAEFAKDPLRALSELRSRCPVAKSSHWGGFWLLTGYDEVFDALHTPEIFSSRPDEQGVRGVPPQPGAGSLVPIDYDAPDVGVYRSFLLSALSPGSAR